MNSDIINIKPSWSCDAQGVFVKEGDKKVSYPESASDDCFNMEDHSLWFKQRNDLILSLINKHAISGNFLDIGGGNGFQVKALLDNHYNKEVYLCEPAYQGCLNARKRNITNVYNGFFQDFPFDEKNIRVVGLFDVIEHIEDDIKFLNKLYEKIPTYSKVLITVPALMRLFSQVDTYSGHFRRYEKKDLLRFEQQTKFKIIDSGFYFSFYYLPLFLLRVIPYKLGIRNSEEEIRNSENSNHQSKASFIDGYLQSRHKFWLDKLKKEQSASYGTSMFMVLEKE